MTAEPRAIQAPGRPGQRRIHTFGGGRWCSARCAWLVEGAERPLCGLLGVSLPPDRTRHRACRQAELRPTKGAAP